jgi:hypothetical protein
MRTNKPKARRYWIKVDSSPTEPAVEVAIGHVKGRKYSLTLNAFKPVWAAGNNLNPHDRQR